jgi:hypothetical protein
MLKTHIVMSSLICCLILILVFRLALTLVLRLTLFSRALPHTSSCASPQFTHGPNHHSYDFVP